MPLYIFLIRYFILVVTFYHVKIQNFKYIAVIGKNKNDIGLIFFTTISLSKQWNELDMYLIRKIFLVSNIQYINILILTEN